MKHVSVPVDILGEKYLVSGDSASVNQILALFRETLETVRRSGHHREVSSHRLAVMSALALAEQLVILRNREKKRGGLLEIVRREIASLGEQVQDRRP